MAYSTDGGLAAFDLVILKDNKEANPIYAPAPRVRGAVISQYPELGDILNPVFESLSLETLQSLNEKTAVEGQVPAAVAEGYLRDKGLLK
jgi:osmoprotectant transport system substrate-binding protein